MFSNAHQSEMIGKKAAKVLYAAQIASAQNIQENMPADGESFASSTKRIANLEKFNKLDHISELKSYSLELDALDLALPFEHAFVAAQAELLKTAHDKAKRHGKQHHMLFKPAPVELAAKATDEKYDISRKAQYRELSDLTNLSPNELSRAEKRQTRAAGLSRH
ncbi:MAG: hypothetical protein ACK4PR_02965 [Gammaproteobacteria bacterium]